MRAVPGLHVLPAHSVPKPSKPARSASEEDDAFLLVGIGARDERTGDLVGGVERLVRDARRNVDEVAFFDMVEMLEIEPCRNALAIENEDAARAP